MNWGGKRVLVTGAGGFIGSHLAERLAEDGATVRAMVHYTSTGRWGWLEESPLAAHMEIVAGDVCDRDAVTRSVRDVDIVFHLAALIAIPYSYEAPESYVRTNIGGTLNLLQASREMDVTRFVHTSTSEVYGTALYVPIDEQHPLQGQSPYSASKIGADKMAEAFCRSFELPVTTVRPFNTFGPRQSARAIVPTILTQCLTSETIRLGSLHPTRDLNYVSNTVDGYLLAATTDEAAGLTINLGSGREISIGDLVTLVSSITGRALHVSEENERRRPKASEVERLLADSQLAKMALGWAPRVSLEEGLQLTYEWMQSHLTRYRPGVYAV